MNVLIKVGSWTNLGRDAARIRQTVFCEEQGIPAEEEWDQWDDTSLHVVAYDALANDTFPIAIATGRLLPDGHIGRMAVLKSHRGRGVGGKILEKLIAQAREISHSVSHSGNLVGRFTNVQLHAQIRVMGFYSRYGFIPSGANFLEVGIPHVLMRLNLA